MGYIHAAAKRQLFQVALVLHLDIFFQLHMIHAMGLIQYSTQTLLYSFVNNEDDRV
jgi:hypothetical protein